MIARLRKWWINKRIVWAVEAQDWYQRQARGALDEKENKRKLESLLRQKLTEVDHPLPRILRSRSLT